MGWNHSLAGVGSRLEYDSKTPLSVSHSGRCTQISALGHNTRKGLLLGELHLAVQAWLCKTVQLAALLVLH